MSDEQPRRQKYRHTRELIKIALDEGMTQEEIARLCRTQQSTVSAWKNGKSKATVPQIESLLKRFGARVRRQAARVYLLGDPVDRYGTPTGGPPGIHVVEGPIVFRHVFTRSAIHPSRRGGDLVNEPIARWIVHELHGPSFILVRQTRRKLSDREQKTEWSQIEKDLYDLQHDMQTSLKKAVALPFLLRRWVETADDAARWESVIEQARTLTDLLARVDQEPYELAHEATTVRFLIRKALLEHGHAIPGVDRTASSE